MPSPEILAATRLQLRARDCEHRLQVDLQGELDVLTGPRLLALLDAALADPAIHAVHISALYLRAVDGDGFAVLVGACRRVTSTGRLFAVGEPPTSLLRLAQRSGTEELLGLAGCQACGLWEGSQASVPSRGRTRTHERTSGASALTTTGARR